MKKSKVQVIIEPFEDELNPAHSLAQTGGKEEQDKLLILLDRFRDGLALKLHWWAGAPWNDADDTVGHVLMNLVKAVRERRLATPKIPWWMFLYTRVRKLYWKNKRKRCGFTVPLEESEWADESDLPIDAVRLNRSKPPRSCYLDPTPAEWKEEAEIAARNAGKRLNSREKAIVNARVAGMSHHEIAKALGTSTTAVRVQYCRAHKKMRDTA